MHSAPALGLNCPVCNAQPQQPCSEPEDGMSGLLHPIGDNGIHPERTAIWQEQQAGEIAAAPGQ